MGILIVVFIIAIFTDWRFYKIPNLCIFIGMCSGLIMTYMSYGICSVTELIMQMLIIFTLFYPFYLIGGIGAGDVKLFMMTACFIKGGKLIDYMLVTMMTASVISVIKMIMYTESRERLFYLGRYIRKAVLTGVIDEYETDKTRKKSVIRLSIPAFISLLIMYMGVY